MVGSMQSTSAIVTVPHTASTQDDLVAAATDAEAWPHLSALRAVRQSGGHGRDGRRWDTEGMEALTASVVVRPSFPRHLWPWIGMLTGVAAVDTLTALGAPAGLKWPNDLVLSGGEEIDGWGRWRKVGGILSQVLADGSAVVVGIGINLAGAPPVRWASALDAHGITVEAEAVLDILRGYLDRALESPSADWKDAVERRCVTIGTPVTVSLPGGAQIHGRARGIDDDGGLMIDDGARTQVVLAGDVEHCRVQTAPAR